MDAPEHLPETLALERIEVNLFRGRTPDTRPGRIFGGQVIAQSLLAAYETVEARTCHSLHCYFIRPGDPTIPILFEVDRARDGGSFTTRRVTAIQHGLQIFNLAASFQEAEAGFDHQAPTPAAPRPETLIDESVLRRKQAATADVGRAWILRPGPVEMRWADPDAQFPDNPGEPRNDIWFRVREPIGDNPRLHQAILAYASDFSLLGTALRPHGRHWRSPGLQIASLDHAMWFHRPTDFTRWHLYHQVSPSASGGRGFVRGEIFREDGELVASTAQEGLIRQRRPG